MCIRDRWSYGSYGAHTPTIGAGATVDYPTAIIIKDMSPTNTTSNLAATLRLQGGGPRGGGLEPGAQGPLLAPRDDLLSPDQARQLHLELLAGNEPPQDVPQWMCDLLAIADSGCGTSFGNTTRVYVEDSIYDEECSVNGAAGAFTTTKKGTMKMPMETDTGEIGAYREDGAILHEACAYSLIAVGRASREQGVSMWMPPHGEHGSFRYPNGVSITLLNRYVLVVRPIGYKVSPHSTATRPGWVLPDTTNEYM